MGIKFHFSVKHPITLVAQRDLNITIRTVWWVMWTVIGSFLCWLIPCSSMHWWWRRAQPVSFSNGFNQVPKSPSKFTSCWRALQLLLFVWWSS